MAGRLLLFRRGLCLRSVLVLLLCTGATSFGQSRYSLAFLADRNFPTSTTLEQLLGGTAVTVANPRAATSPEEEIQGKASGDFGGISGIAYDPDSRLLYALSDSTKPTLFVFALDLAPGVLRLKFNQMVRLTTEAGAELPLWTLDPEGVALTEAGTLLIASEGYVRRSPPVQPGLSEFTVAGRQTSAYPIPSHFLRPPDGTRSGVQSNRAFEGLSLSPDQSRLFVSTEGPLEQDAAACREDGACMVRILAYDASRLEQGAVAEYHYRYDPPEAPEDFGSAARTMGLSEITALDPHNLLTLERGFSFTTDGRTHQVIRIYHVQLPSDGEATRVMLEKQLVLDVGLVAGQFSEGFRRLDNFEGMCLGPRLPNGDRSVLIVSDNNYSERQRTSFVAFRLKESSGPGR